MRIKDLLARLVPNTVKARLGSAFWSLKTVYWSLREFLDPGAQRQGPIPPKSLIASVGGLDFQATGQEFKRYFKGKPEAAIAFHEKTVRDLYQRSDIEVLEPIRWGGWSGRDGYLSWQDLIFARKL